MPLKKVDHSRYRKARRRAADKKLAALQHFVWDWKRLHGCTDCGETDPLVLDCDHRDRAAKIDGIAKMIRVRRCTRDQLLAELEKCDVRCANCHRRKTFFERHPELDPATWTC